MVGIKVYAFELVNIGSGTSEAEADIDRLIDDDFDVDTAEGEERILGATFYNECLYLVERVPGSVIAFDLDGNEVEGSGFSLTSDNSNPQGLTFADDRFWVCRFYR